MGKIVMPKNSALLNEIESVLEIYYEASDWLPNDEYKAKLKLMIGDDQYSSSYTKKAQITSYFGFTIWEDINDPQSRRKITPSGKKMFEAIKAEDTVAVQDVLMRALETVKFGRDNYGCPDSSSDVEPPSLFVRAILDMGYLTYREFAFLLWKLEDLGANYTDALAELKELRSRGTIDLGEEANKYVDCKPIIILVRWGFLAEDTTDSSGGKHIIIAPEVLAKYETRLRNLKIYNIDMDCDEPITNDHSNREKGNYIPINLDIRRNSKDGANVLLYGVPGSGKSFTIDSIVSNSKYERVVFHPDYTYSDFVGQIMPRIKRNADGTEKLTYEFVPGPFTKALKVAVDNEDSMYYLVIEEINRGNAPAIFGDIFQLLDRNEDGSGKYHITNFDIAREVYGDEEAEIRIPSNLSILATMNTSDQNVFTLDTAFQRRWNMKYIENNVAEAEHANEKIEYSDVTWGGFASAVNEEILEYNAELSSSEDKQLGAYFVTRTELTSDKFPEKALKYLWDDAFKLEREKIFRPEIKSIGDLVHCYDVEIQSNRDPIKGVMRAEVYRKMMDMSASSTEEAIDETERFEAEINNGE